MHLCVYASTALCFCLRLGLDGTSFSNEMLDPLSLFSSLSVFGPLHPNTEQVQLYRDLLKHCDNGKQDADLQETDAMSFESILIEAWRPKSRGASTQNQSCTLLKSVWDHSDTEFKCQFAKQTVVTNVLFTPSCHSM